VHAEEWNPNLVNSVENTFSSAAVLLQLLYFKSGGKPNSIVNNHLKRQGGLHKLIYSRMKVLING